MSYESQLRSVGNMKVSRKNFRLTPKYDKITWKTSKIMKLEESCDTDILKIAIALCPTERDVMTFKIHYQYLTNVQLSMESHRDLY